MTDLPKTEKLYLDDLVVGAEFNSEKYAVIAEEIREFAKNFDPQPFHLDEETARKTLFGGLVASGWHTAAITMRLLFHSVPIAGGIIGVGGEITWPTATKPGDVLNVVSTIVNISPSRTCSSKAKASGIALRAVFGLLPSCPHARVMLSSTAWSSESDNFCSVSTRDMVTAPIIAAAVAIALFLASAGLAWSK
jgi:acyl dehydratase